MHHVNKTCTAYMHHLLCDARTCIEVDPNPTLLERFHSAWSLYVVSVVSWYQPTTTSLYWAFRWFLFGSLTLGPLRSPSYPQLCSQAPCAPSSDTPATSPPSPCTAPHTPPSTSCTRIMAGPRWAPGRRPLPRGHRRGVRVPRGELGV